MFSRFSLAILLAVLAAASKPLATGGTHDLLAFGVVVEETGADGKPVRRLALGMPEGDAKAAYEELLHTSARAALVQGTTVYAPAPAQEKEGPRVVEVIYYGHASRAGRAPVAFVDKPGAELPGATRAHEAGRGLARLPSTVTAAAARVLLRTHHVEAYAEALDALARVEADAASAEARVAAVDASAPIPRRIVAIRTLARLGGAAAHPEVYRRIAGDPEPAIRDAAK